jgi:hypothetical protein
MIITIPVNDVAKKLLAIGIFRYFSCLKDRTQRINNLSVDYATGEIRSILSGMYNHLIRLTKVAVRGGEEFTRLESTIELSNENRRNLC